MKQLSKEQAFQVTGGRAVAMGAVAAIGSGALAGFASPIPGGAILGAVGAGVAYGVTRLAMWAFE